ncbi:type II toxin-antitoxin system RelE/ParE family toxin [Kibdelosporangium philippinense]|uniref:Type II toxin-antitoxin system RelE/ParE family toxin n=1 Tax=Kibdelosporangium philippinense TaxID=211113 RepID=A0ABS8ZFA9_9PSEU|nr:type II toxin-antitoxin system RelE/ParE family toxin [Kibdelosporangium philippinense]MCE7005208.1 type II toxin-antitoxin system RelE/ParE family toxin [Kibdelosporangium philippinense]
MPYEIEWTAAALRELRKLDRQTVRRIVLAVTTLGADPRPSGCRALSGQPAGVRRIRVGDYRIVYQVDDGKILVTVVRVAHRREVYRNL